MKHEMNTPLFTSRSLRLASVDPEKDAAVDSTWTYRLEYAQGLRDRPARPLSTFELKKIYEDALKKASENNNSFFFAIHLKAGDRLIGFLRIPWISWTTGVAPLQLFFGETSDLNTFGQEALELTLRYTFDELNLHHVHATVSSGDAENIAFYERNGFKLEVRQRAAIYRGGSYFDRLLFGILRMEWENSLEEVTK